MKMDLNSQIPKLWQSIFAKKRKAHDDPELYLNETPIRVVTEAKFLGVKFDNKLSFIPHMKELKIKCQKALNLLKVVGHFDWGADRKTLLSLYRSTIRAKLDYGSIVYGSARASYREMLDPIQHQALRICLGAFRTSPAYSLYVEANEPPLNLRRTKLALQYIIKLKSTPSNPAYNCVFNPTHQALFEDTNFIPPFGLYHKHRFRDFNLDLIIQTTGPPFPPWEYIPPLVDTSLAGNKKDLTSPAELRQEFLALRNSYRDRISIYTDGSKIEEKVAAAAIAEGRKFLRRLPDHSSIYSAEVTALGLALQYVMDSPHKQYAIYSDSLSSLQALQTTQRNPLLLEVMQMLSTATNSGKDVLFCWVPSHVGVSGNEAADSLAKAALKCDPSDMQIPYTDFKTLVKPYIFQEWEQFWSAIRPTDNKLRDIKPSLGEWKHSNRTSRREEVVLARLRIGHTHLTHSHLLKGEPPPECDLCGETLTVKHLLIECIALGNIRNRFYTANSMQSLFEGVNPTHICDFLKHIKVFYKL